MPLVPRTPRLVPELTPALATLATAPLDTAQVSRAQPAPLGPEAALGRTLAPPAVLTLTALEQALVRLVLQDLLVTLRLRLALATADTLHQVQAPVSFVPTQRPMVAPPPLRR